MAPSVIRNLPRTSYSTREAAPNTRVLGLEERDGLIMAGELTVNLKLRTVAVKSQHTHLTKGQFDLLLKLLHRAGEVVPFEELHQVACGVSRWRGDTRPIRQQLSKLAKSIGDSKTLIRNVRGVGYALVLQ